MDLTTLAAALFFALGLLGGRYLAHSDTVELVVIAAAVARSRATGCRSIRPRWSQIETGADCRHPSLIPTPMIRPARTRASAWRCFQRSLSSKSRRLADRTGLRPGSDQACALYRGWPAARPDQRGGPPGRQVPANSGRPEGRGAGRLRAPLCAVERRETRALYHRALPAAEARRRQGFCRSPRTGRRRQGKYAADAGEFSIARCSTTCSASWRCFATIHRPPARRSRRRSPRILRMRRRS